MALPESSIDGLAALVLEIRAAKPKPAAGDPRAAGDRPAPSVVGERGNLSGEAA